MYAKILLVLTLFFLSYTSVSGSWINAPWVQRHTQYWSYTRFPPAIITMLQNGDLAGATRAQEAEYRKGSGGRSVQYKFSKSGNTIALACNNSWLTIFEIPAKEPPPPPIAGVCNATGELAAELSGPSCTIGAGSAFTVSSTNPKQYTWTCAGQNGGANRSCNAQFTHPECDISTSNMILRESEFSTPTCKYGNVTGFTETTDTTGKVTYKWTCENGKGTPASCNAFYKELDPTNCDERRVANDTANTTQFGHPARLPEQCTYSVIPNQPSISMTGLVMATQDGPSVVYLTGSYGKSNNGISGRCVIPKNGIPQVDFAADPFTTITSTLTSFTLPSTVTQKAGNGTINFNAPDTCNARIDTITVKAITPDCDTTIIDTKNPRYCKRTISETEVCLALKDKYSNPIYDFATNRITTVLGKVEKNEYFSKYNNGAKDPTQYIGGTYSVVGNNYCEPICLECDTRVACTKGMPLAPKCNVVAPPPVPSCVEYDGSPKCPTVTSTACTPSFANNYCNPIGTITPVSAITTNPGGEITFDRKKACTGEVQVWNGSTWTNDGESIIYDEPSLYRLAVRGTDPVCKGGIIQIKSVTPKGGSFFENQVAYTSTGAFTAIVQRRSVDNPKTDRGVNVVAIYTQPGGLVYGLTATATDFLDNVPLTIYGNRMKGVRIIGNSAGTNVTNFNLNNAGVIGENSGPTVSTTRNAMLRNASLLTRGVESGETVNKVKYIEGNNIMLSSLGTGFTTLIVKGNLTIDRNIIRTEELKGIIVLKGSSISKLSGNIIVADSVTYINALVFAEETFRGESTNPAILNPDRQLVLQGTLFSRNTVGGSADEGNNNLYLAGGGKTTDSFLAFTQDLNNVRNGYGCREGEISCGLYVKSGFTYLDPFIIDFDNMQANPPPGFSNIQ